MLNATKDVVEGPRLRSRSCGCAATVASSKGNLEEQIIYKYVTKRLPNNVSRMPPGFYAQYKGKQTGPFPTQRAAAQEAAQLAGVPANSLLKPQARQAAEEESARRLSSQ